MTHFKSIESSDGSSFAIIYSDCTQESISQLIENVFNADGYSTKSGNLGDRTYVKGNRVARLLLGAFYKYFEFYVGAGEHEGDVIIRVRKASSGMSGGLIGVNQVKKELARLESALRGI